MTCRGICTKLVADVEGGDWFCPVDHATSCYKNTILVAIVVRVCARLPLFHFKDNYKMHVRK